MSATNPAPWSDAWLTPEDRKHHARAERTAPREFRRELYALPPLSERPAPLFGHRAPSKAEARRAQRAKARRDLRDFAGYTLAGVTGAFGVWALLWLAKAAQLAWYDLTGAL